MLKLEDFEVQEIEQKEIIGGTNPYAHSEPPLTWEVANGPSKACPASEEGGPIIHD